MLNTGLINAYILCKGVKAEPQSSEHGGAEQGSEPQNRDQNPRTRIRTPEQGSELQKREHRGSESQNRDQNPKAVIKGDQNPKRRIRTPEQGSEP